MSLKAFVYLNKILLLKQKVQACWTILFSFGYDTNLSLTEDYIQSRSKNFASDGVVELSKDGIDFLIMLWDQYEDTEVADMYILEKMFSTLEGGCPFFISEIAVVNDGKVTLSTWTDVWQMLVRDDCKQAFRYALYLGYDKFLENFVTVIKKSNWQIFGTQEKSVFGCALVERKVTLLSRLIGLSQETTRSAVLSLAKNKTLVMREVRRENIEELLGNESKKLKEFDMCLFIHDGSLESADFIKAYHTQISKALPKAIIDISEGASEEVTAEQLAKSLKDALVPKARVSLDSKTQVVEAVRRLAKML